MYDALGSSIQFGRYCLGQRCHLGDAHERCSYCTEKARSSNPASGLEQGCLEKFPIGNRLIFSTFGNLLRLVTSRLVHASGPPRAGGRRDSTTGMPRRIVGYATDKHCPNTSSSLLMALQVLVLSGAGSRAGKPQ